MTPDQVHWHRLRQNGLVEPFGSAEETARRLLGVQAQLIAAADLAFWQRTRDCTVAGLRQARLEQRSLVRFWGQRNTIHIYASEDWDFLHTALGEVHALIRRRLEKAGLQGDFQRLVTRTRKRLAEGQKLTYADIRSSKLAEIVDRPQTIAYLTFMQLVRQGVACHAEERGAESRFVHREHWLPDRAWSPPSAASAYGDLAVRYLKTYGPAEVADLAHWYGTSQKAARQWIESAASRLASARVDDRTVWYVAADHEQIVERSPARSRWPVRMLYRFDPLLLATRDKSWLIDEAAYKQVWRPAAHVEAVLLVRGRIAGTWRYDRSAKGLSIRLQPLQPLSQAVQRAAKKEAKAIAKFLELPLRECVVNGTP